MEILRRTLLVIAIFVFLIITVKQNVDISAYGTVIIILSILLIWKLIADGVTYLQIAQKGKAGTAILTSCKTPIMRGGKWNIPFRCNPVVTFFLHDEKKELEVYGIFYRPPGIVGTPVQIIY